jgi:hypothetical protein
LPEPLIPIFMLAATTGRWRRLPAAGCDGSD